MRWAGKLKDHRMARGWIKILTSAVLWKTSVPQPFSSSYRKKPCVRPPVKYPIQDIQQSCCYGLWTSWSMWKVLADSKETGKGLRQGSQPSLREKIEIFWDKNIQTEADFISVWSLESSGFGEANSKDLLIWPGALQGSPYIKRKEKKNSEFSDQHVSWI